MSLPSFNHWLRRQHQRDDRIGDLARDVRQDRQWPGCRTLAGFQRYLGQRNACSAAVESLAAAWTEYSRR